MQCILNISPCVTGQRHMTYEGICLKWTGADAHVFYVIHIIRSVVCQGLFQWDKYEKGNTHKMNSSHSTSRSSLYVNSNNRFLLKYKRHKELLYPVVFHISQLTRGPFFTFPPEMTTLTQPFHCDYKVFHMSWDRDLNSFGMHVNSIKATV